MKIIRRMYDWMGSKAHSPFGIIWLSILFFIEASVLIIPVDPLLILFCIEHRKKSFLYAAISTTASVIGGLFGYMIGLFLWDTVGQYLVHYLISPETFGVAVARYKLYEAWAVLIGAFTPVPYKAITISAGFCKLPILPFIFYSIVGRGVRFFLLAGAIYLWGERIKRFIDKYFNYLVIAFTLVVILSCSLLKG